MTQTSGGKNINRLGTYGKPEMIRVHKEAQVKYPTEVAAAKHIFDPEAAAFIPAPIRPLEIWCPGCRSFQKPEKFHGNRARPNGKHSYCKMCRKKSRTGKKPLPIAQISERWYRG